MKTNIEWYPHRKDSHRHPKFKLLRTLYGGGNSGWAMEARFWALNNLIADCEGRVLDISKTRNKAVVAEELGLSLEDLEQFILRLISSDIELLYEASPGKYSTKKVSEALETAMAERSKSRTKKKKSTVAGGKDEISTEFLENTPGKNNTVNNIRVKEKTIKESKVKETDDSATSGEIDEGLPLTSYSDLNFSFPTENKIKPTKENGLTQIGSVIEQMGFEEKGVESSAYPVVYDELQVRKCIEEMLVSHTKLKPDKATLSAFTNIVCKKNKLTSQVKHETSYKILQQCCTEFSNFKEKQQNYRYLYKKFTGRISDALIRARESRARASKQ